MHTILLVEDQLELRAIHTAYLQSHGYRVVAAGDGEAGLEAARDNRPDVIVLDHSLPHRTGIDVATELQRDPALSSIPIVMVTAHAYGAIGRKARAAGCVAFLSKPCQPSRLLEEIARWTHSPASA